MGGHAYWYIVPYEQNVQSALNKLRAREFKAGRYNPVMPIIKFPITPDSPAPGAQHASINEVMQAADATGSRSILDLHTIGDEPDSCVACLFSSSKLRSVYGTDQPTHEMVERNDGYFDEDLERGEGLYFVVYKDGKPYEILFAGCSFD